MLWQSCGNLIFQRRTQTGTHHLLLRHPHHHGTTPAVNNLHPQSVRTVCICAHRPSTLSLQTVTKRSFNQLLKTFCKFWLIKKKGLKVFQLQVFSPSLYKRGLHRKKTNQSQKKSNSQKGKRMNPYVKLGRQNKKRFSPKH